MLSHQGGNEKDQLQLHFVASLQTVFWRSALVLYFIKQKFLLEPGATRRLRLRSKGCCALLPCILAQWLMCLSGSYYLGEFERGAELEGEHLPTSVIPNLCSLESPPQ